MKESNSSNTTSEPPDDKDLEKGDRAVHPVGSEETNTQSTEPESPKDDSPSGNIKDEALFQPSTNTFDDADPFAMFPTLSISMSSTRGPWMRRNTTTTLGRPLTREETMQTLKTVRSRFTDARSEFDENVYWLRRFLH